VPALIVKLAGATGAFDVTAALVYDGDAIITGIRTAQMGVLVLGQYYQSSAASTPYFIGSDGLSFGAQPPAEGGSDIIVCYMDTSLVGVWAARISGVDNDIATSGISATGSDG
jgi:hypothetical protein